MANGRSLAFNSNSFLDRVGSRKTTRLFRKKQTIYSQGEKADAMFYIQAGTVKLSVISNGGKRAVLAMLGPNEFFGEGCLVTGSLRISTAVALQPSALIQIRKATILQIIREDPAFAKLVISHLLTRSLRWEENFVDQIVNSSDKRLARVLLLLTGFGKRTKPEVGLLKVNQGTLAEMIGTTRSRVSFFMNRFRRMGLIDYNGSLQVHRALLAFLKSTAK